MSRWNLRDHPWWMGAVAAAMAMPAGGVAAQEPQPDLRAEIQQLREEVAELRARQQEGWLNERRTEEVREIVADVLADAEARGDFGGGGLVAGHDGDFFLGSEDGAFRLEFGGHLQVRYIANFRDNAPGNGDDAQTGFQIRRAKLKGEGTLFTPDLGFGFSLAGDRDGATAFFEDYYLQYEFADNWAVRAGRWKQPFARENMVSSSRQLTIERASVLESFNVDRSEGVMLRYKSGVWAAYGSINNGAEAEFSDFDSDANTSDFAFTGRGELLLAGEWDQFKDFSAWSDEPLGVLLGGAVHYQIGETGTGEFVESPPGSGIVVSVPNNDNFLRWTADLSVEINGLGLFLAGYGNHQDNEGGDSFDDFGVEAMVGYMLIPDTFEPFVRYEFIMPDEERPGGTGDNVSIVTAGFNWYQKKHNAKFTLDVVYALNPLVGIVGRSQSLGLDDDAAGEEGQTSIRAQYQLAF